MMIRIRTAALAIAFGIGLMAGALPDAAEAQSTAREARAVFAGGCFWCMQPPFDALPGVIATMPGYAGGIKPNPTYKEVSAGGTGYKEVVEVVYDPAKVSYSQLLDVYWRNIDPLDGRGQFCDRGDQYTSAIFAASPEERAIAEKSKAAVAARFRQQVATEILPAVKFYPAEDYHQDYYRKNPVRYSFYRSTCGRDRRLRELNGTS